MIDVAMLQVKIKFGLNFLNQGWFSYFSFVCMLVLILIHD